MERGSLAGDLGRGVRPGERGLVLERDEECRRRCRGREDLDLERRRRRLELWWPGLGRRERSRTWSSGVLLGSCLARW